MDSKKKTEDLTENLTATRKYIPSSSPEEMLNSSASAQNALPKIDFNKLKTKLNDFQKKLVKKFPFTIALTILPPVSYPIFEEDENMAKEIIDTKPIHLLMLMPEEHYKDLAKIKAEVIELIKSTGENLWIHIKSVEIDLWNYGLDSKFEFIDAIAASFPLYDKGLLGSLRVANIHKNLVLNWLNFGRVKYVASYVIGGSLIRGTADETSDVDTFIIIDDTDVKRMSRIELLEKLRGRIVSEFVKEATALAGVKNILNVQVYLLTDFWQSVKDAQPVMFTFIRDGIPLYDRGTFIPWKRLLQMGRIKPSAEAIDLYMKEGDRTNELVKRRLLDAMIDVYYGVVTPTQAMMMLAGHAPPVPKTIVADVKKVLVDEEKVMSQRELQILERVVKYFKDYEHGKLNEIPGKEIDSLMEDFKEFTKKVKELREKLEKRIQEHQAEKLQEEVFSLLKKIFGNKSQEVLIKDLDEELVKKGKIHGRMSAIAKEILDIKKKVSGKKAITTSEMQSIVRNASDLMNSLMEYSQRKELVSAEKGLMQISYNGKKAEVLSANNEIFVVEEGQKIFRLDLQKKKLVESSKQELESALDKVKERVKFTLPAGALEILKKELGDFSIVF